MTSYVYNPSKKVTELLSNFLEFDREQLKLGIWSGHLELSNVKLRPTLFGNDPKNDTVFQLVDSEIGFLSLKIPWKRLVWGAGDVQVELRNVTVKVQVQSRTPAHNNNQPHDPDPTTTSDKNNNHHTTPILGNISPQQKSRLIREAEKRLVTKRSIGPWLEHIAQKQNPDDLKNSLQSTNPVEQRSSQWLNFLRNNLNHIFWRCGAGLQLTLSNIQVTMVQDGIEVGWNVPSIRVVPPHPSTQSHSDNNNNNNTTLDAAVPEHAVYRGEHDDGEHVDKHVWITGLGVHVRQEHQQLQDVYTGDYVLRPVNIDFRFSLFIPLPPSQQRQAKRKSPLDENATVSETDTSSSVKKRRGKRDKEPSTTTILSGEATAELTDVLPPPIPPPTDFHSSFGSGLNISPAAFHRMSSIGNSVNRKRRSSLHMPARPTQGRARQATVSLPLAQPDDVGAFYASKTKHSAADVAKCDGRLTISKIQVVCSNHHYKLLHLFLTGAVKVRNGRPKRSIASVIATTPSVDENFDETSSALEALNDSERVSRQAVVRSWWIYAYSSVSWELRRRRKIRNMFQQKYLSFSWDRQSYRRQEYVNLFLEYRLDPAMATDRLLELEQELNIEQVLLYRAIARSVHVHGLEEMPSSILQLGPSDERLLLANGPRPTLEAANDAESDKDPQSGEDSNFLSMLDDRCRVARARRDGSHEEPIAMYLPGDIGAKHSYRRNGGLSSDDSSFVWTSESLTVWSSQKPKSVCTSTIESLATSKEDSAGLFFSFHATVGEVEIDVVEDDTTATGYGATYNSPSGIDSDNSGSGHVSDVSVLTDDERFFREQSGDSLENLEQAETNDPIFRSSDFLIFSQPKKVILRLAISKVTCSCLGRTGASRNVNLAISKIVAVGDRETQLLEIGTPNIREAPIPEVQVSSHSLNSVQRSSFQGPNQAVSLSFVYRKGTRFLQCDAPTVKIALCARTARKLANFCSQSTASFPGDLLPDCPSEETRLFILGQKDSVRRPLNCSVRVHGCEVSFFGGPAGRPPEEDDSLPIGLLHCKIIEIYSGSIVEDLRLLMEDIQESDFSAGAVGKRPSATRALRMIDVPEIMSSNSSNLASHWVFTTIGLDFELLQLPANEACLLKEPLDIEMISSLSNNFLPDSNRARNESIVKVSPIHLLLSETRMKTVSSMDFNLSKYFVKTTAASNVWKVLPPRIEVLSSFVRGLVDVSFRRIRCSLLEEVGESSLLALTSRQRVSDCLSGFLTAIARFDLSYPHEDALSAAMQVCIDRLNGIGIPLEEAWEATNQVLLTFLEDVAEARLSNTSEDGKSSDQDSILDETLLIEKTIKKSAESTADDFADRIEGAAAEIEHEKKAAILDLPDGMSLSSIFMFYDRHVSLDIPSVFVADRSGLHLLRATPPETESETDPETSSLLDSFGSGGSDSVSGPSDNGDHPAHFGISLKHFKVDKLFDFGKGGLQLDALGSDEADGSSRSIEQLFDATLGDVEVLFAESVVAGVVRTVSRVFSPLKTPVDDRKPAVGTSTRIDSDASLTLSCEVVTALLLAEQLLPFARVTLTKVVGRTQSRSLDRPDAESVTRFAAHSCNILNLTPEGELFPVTLSLLPNRTGPQVFVDFTKAVDTSTLLLKFCGFRTTFLKQFLNEMLQYLLSGEYGIGKLVQGLGNHRKAKRRKLQLRLVLEDSSLIVPRSSNSYDMICIEFDSVTVVSSKPAVTFRMPTSTSRLQLDRVASDRTTAEQPVSRVRVSIKGFHIYTSLIEHHNTNSRQKMEMDHPSFRFYYSLNGRASDSKRVYQRHATVEEPEASYDEEVFERASCQWRQITEVTMALEVVVDYAPHLRLLFSDSFNSASCDSEGIQLNVNQSQFCLLLAVWFMNMQELPLMFPFSGKQLLDGTSFHRRDVVLPEFGTPDFKSYLSSFDALTSEVAIVAKKLSLRCSSGESDHDSSSNGVATSGILVDFNDVVLHVANDDQGICRIGSACSSARLVDESEIFSTILNLKGTPTVEPWADIFFGLNENVSNQENNMSQPFQFSVFMTPGWYVYNLGLHRAGMCLSDFNPVFRFLGFVSAWASDDKYGNPSFEALERVNKIKRELKSALGISSGSTKDDKGSSNTEFRLWLLEPTLAIPCDPRDINSPAVKIKSDGIVWYRYCSIDNVQFQECVSPSLGLYFGDVFGSVEERALIEYLSMALRLNGNSTANHTDYSLRIPFNARDACGLGTWQHPFVRPLIAGQPNVCSPYGRWRRELGPTVCEITCVIEVLPLVSSALLGLFGGETSDPVVVSGAASLDSEHSGILAGEEKETRPNDTLSHTTSFSASVGDLRVFLLDPVLGPFLPVALFCVSSVNVTVSRFGTSIGSVRDSKPIPTSDLHASVQGTIWADYFKLGLTKSWEPLLEPYNFFTQIEKSRDRGTGISLKSDCSLHVNVTSSLLIILDEVVDSFRQLVRETLGEELPPTSELETSHLPRQEKWLLADSCRGKELTHELPAQLPIAGRVAYSIQNLTGQSMRVLRCDEQDDGTAVLTYLRHCQTSKLVFRPSVSMIKNLSITEVPYPGVPNACREHQPEVAAHSVNLHIPGFRLLRSIPVDTFGRRFVNLIPQSLDVSTKVDSDWQIANVMNLLIEVGLKNGGRQVSARSPFTFVNKTSHSIGLLLHPDPNYRPHRSVAEEQFGIEDLENESVYEMQPSSSFHVPPLLFDSSLRQPEASLGAFWMRPASRVAMDIQPAVRKNADSGFDVDFSSRPVLFSKIVHESSELFEAGRGDDIPADSAKTGTTFQCPVLNSEGGILAPYCYALEIGRSPIIASGRSSKKHEKEDRVHGPIAYTLSIYPPLLLANLLPAKGRFELMHAVRRTILWSGYLMPGEQIPIHAVGLDTPLLLFIDLGFARTPVSAGALVHHGSDPPPSARGAVPGLKSIGKAGKAVTKQLGKRLTAIGESPDHRGQQRFFLAQNPQFQSITKPKADRNQPIGQIHNDGDGKTFKVDSFHFFPDDVEEETSVVDGLGQRLTLRLENTRGGGGQRQVSVFCPLWILNTTEHCLLYKQENSNVFVSGTVHSPNRDGSRLLSGTKAVADGAARVARNETRSDLLAEAKTVFSGMPGALASFHGRYELEPEEVAPLLERDIPLEKMAELSFMFNFQDGPVLAFGQQKLSVRLADGSGSTKYESDWSKGFSVNSIGISQVVSLHCKDGKVLELTAVVTVAPGFLSNYTKVIRLLPRYIVVSRLPYPVRIWQDSSIYASVNSQESSIGQFRRTSISNSNQYESIWGNDEGLFSERDNRIISKESLASSSARHITTVMANGILPFAVPDSRNERHLRVDRGSPWDLSPSFPCDAAGEHMLKMTPAFDLTVVPHVDTRASPRYEVRLPPNGDENFKGDLGAWFETQWGAGERVFVKAVRKDSFAFNETDIRVGDELLKIDRVKVHSIGFSGAMQKLKARLRDISTDRGSRGTTSALSLDQLVLIFETVEERLRSVRVQAASDGQRNRRPRFGRPSRAVRHGRPSDRAPLNESYIKAEVKTLKRSDVGMFIILREEPVAPFRIQNNSVASTLFFRQRGCPHHPWHFLRPGESKAYTWEEPLQPGRLLVRVATERLFSRFPQLSDKHADESERDNRNQKQRSYWWRRTKSEEECFFSPTTSVLLEEIGAEAFLPVQLRDRKSSQEFLKLEVCVEGATRLLVCHDASKDDNSRRLRKYLDKLKMHIATENERQDALRQLGSSLPSLEVGVDSNTPVAAAAETLMGDLLEESAPTRPHQLVVQVMEANGLSSDSFAGHCNPYVEVRLTSSSLNRKGFLRTTNSKRTYYVRNSANPSWAEQSFVFDVPPEAVDVPRGHSIQIRVKNFRRVGLHGTLGKTQVYLHSVRDQSPLEGWFPLTGRTGRRELENRTSHWGRGSVKVRIQWVYSTPALLQYFRLLSEQKSSVLQASVVALQKQIRKQKEVDNRKKQDIQGVKSERLQELISLSRANMKIRASQVQRLRKMKRGPVKKLMDPLRKSKAVRHQHLQKKQSPTDSLDNFPEQRDEALGALRERTLSGYTAPVGTEIRKRFNSTSDIVQRIDDRLNLRRQNLGRIESSRNWFTRQHSLEGERGNFPVTSFKFWSSVQAIAMDKDFEIVSTENDLSIRLARQARKETHSQTTTTGSISEKLSLPAGAPKHERIAVERRISDFAKSRMCFDRAARTRMETVMNPGGWLIIRPICALNVPDIYAGMFVKVRYGSEVIKNLSVDARVAPVWFRDNELEGEGLAGLPDSDPRVIGIHVAPQKTSGLIRLSIVGEKGHKKLKSKSEIGVVDLPLSATLAACIEAASDPLRNAAYLRWFPLLDPKDTEPAEGDLGLSRRPHDTEKLSPDMFREYLSPCIQLAITWAPDEQESDHNEAEDAETLNRSEHMQKSQSSVVKNYFNADIGRISVALIDSHRTFELLSLHILDAGIRYWVTDASTRSGLSVGWFQLDYQGESTREPVVIAPTPSDHVVPVFEILAVKDNILSVADVVAYDIIDMSIVEFDVTFEEILVLDMFNFVNTVTSRQGPRSRATEVGTSQSNRYEYGLVMKSPTADEPTMLTILRNESKERKKLYIRKLFLGVVKINVSYVKGRFAKAGQDHKVFQSIGGIFVPEAHQDSDAFLDWSQNTFDDELKEEITGNETRSFPSFLASLFPNLSDAPVVLKDKALSHVFESPSDIFDSLQSFYLNEILGQLYKIVGSLDFVGNPTMLVTSVVSGVRDLVVAPSVAFLRSPTDPSRVGLGVAQGTLSLASHSTSGFFGVLAKLSAAAGQSVATMSLDPDFREWHRKEIVVEVTNLNREWKRRGVQSVERMLARPIVDLVRGVVGGVVGTVVAPWRGYNREGAAGFAKGAAIGVIGLVAKPTVGVIDAFTHFTASIHDIAKSANVLEKRLRPALKLRLPYNFVMQSILAPYNPVTARAGAILESFPIKNSKLPASASETIIHAELLPSVGSETFAIITTLRILLVRVKNDTTGASSYTLCWEVVYAGSGSIASRVDDHDHGHGVALTIQSQISIKCDSERSATSSSSHSQFTPKLSAIRTVKFSSPLEFLQTEDEHKYERETEGEDAREGFTILAEYNYRSQLLRLHNVICCINEDFDRIEHDVSVGARSSTEGYSSFGVFFFEEDPSDSSTSTGRSGLLDGIEDLPWVSLSEFEATTGKTRDEQKRFLSSLRQNWDLSSALEASNGEGGPDWLVEARARATFLGSTKLEATSTPLKRLEGSISEVETSSLRKSLTWRDRHPLPTIKDEGDNDDDDETPMPRDSLLRYSSAKSLSDGHSIHPESLERFSTALLDQDDPTPSQELHMTHSLRTPPLTIDTGTRNVSSDFSSQSFRSANQLLSEASTESSPSLRESLDTPQERAIAVGQLPSPTHVTSNDKQDRLDRIERLMEQLLEITASQTVARNTAPNDTTWLREQVLELQRTVLERHPSTSEHSEVEALRLEVAELRALVSSNNPSDGEDSQRPPAMEQID